MNADQSHLQQPVTSALSETLLITLAFLYDRWRKQRSHSHLNVNTLHCESRQVIVSEVMDSI